MNWLFLFELLYVLILVAVCAHIIYETNSTAKTLAYLLFAIFIPFFGMIFYFSFGINYRKKELYSKKIIDDDSLWEKIKKDIYASSTASGMAIGSLIGALAGPVGMLVGMISGTVTGALLDADHYDFSEDFGSKATNKLQPGTTAIIAEIDEDSSDFIDNAFTPLGATILRSDVDYEYDEYVDDQIDEIDEEIAAERARIKSANTAEKAKIQQKIAQLKDKRNKRISEAKAKHEQRVAKISAHAKDKKAVRLRNRIDKHQTKIAALEGKLKGMEN